MEGAFSNVRYFSSVLWLVASGASGVRERLALHSYEPPLIALRVEGELQDAIGLIVVELAVGEWAPRWSCGRGRLAPRPPRQRRGLPKAASPREWRDDTSQN